MNRFSAVLFAVFSLVLAVTAAHAQGKQQLCFPNDAGKTNCVPVDASNPFPVTSSGGSSSVTQGTSPWVTTITQGANTATVKAASTPPVAADPALVVTQRPEPGAVSTPGCTVGVASAQCLAGLTTARWLQLQNNHATQSIACAWGAVAVLNAANSFMLAPGQSASWGPNTAGVPNQALNCIASGAATPLYTEFR